MSMDKTFTCIVCPRGCSVTVHADGSVTGNSCPRGKEYALSEATDPRRVLTSTVRVLGGSQPLCPVRVDKGIPKAKMMELMDLICSTKVQAPIKLGQVVIASPLGLDCKVIACQEVKDA